MRHGICVCTGPTCGDLRGGGPLLAELRRSIAAAGLAERVNLSRETCLGHCQSGPVVLIWPDAEEGAAARRVPLDQPGAVIYTQVRLADVSALVEQHLGEGRKAVALLARGRVAAGPGLP
jgi:(2Fe-2S) ferredoxin